MWAVLRFCRSRGRSRQLRPLLWADWIVRKIIFSLGLSGLSFFLHRQGPAWHAPCERSSMRNRMGEISAGVSSNSSQSLVLSFRSPSFYC